jgi:hypothetical protein
MVKNTTTKPNKSMYWGKYITLVIKFSEEIMDKITVRSTEVVLKKKSVKTELVIVVSSGK